MIVAVNERAPVSHMMTLAVRISRPPCIEVGGETKIFSLGFDQLEGGL